MDAYEITNRKIFEEVREFYKVNEIFLAIHAGVLISILYVENDFIYPKQTMIGFLGLIISFAWYSCNKKNRIWEDWWIDKAAEFEQEAIGDKKIWREIKEFKECYFKMDDGFVEEKKESIRKLEKAVGVRNRISLIPKVFIIAWLFLIASSLIQYFNINLLIFF